MTEAVAPLAFDPEILAARRRQAELFPAFDPASLPPAEARRRMDKAALSVNDGEPSMAAIEDIAVPGEDSPVRCRLYRPTGVSELAAILFIHGGGWFNCSIETHDRFARCLARDSGAAVLSVDYRLAPEHPFPAGLTDAISAWRWLNGQAQSLSLDPRRLMIAGDSAGANLALAVCVAERDDDRALPKAAALLYGCFAPDFDTPSQLALGDGRAGLTTARMRWYWTNYIGPDLEHPPRLAAPARDTVARLPPIHICYGDLDPLADESRLLAASLHKSGVECELRGWPGAGHGFLQLTRDAAIAREATAAAAQFLARF